jgi:hypothetical protein
VPSAAKLSQTIKMKLFAPSADPVLMITYSTTTKLWRIAMTAMPARRLPSPDEFEILQHAATKCEGGVVRSTIGVQSLMSNLVSIGLMEEVRSPWYQVTPQGLAIVGMGAQA